MHVPIRLSPGDLIDYRGRPALILGISSRRGWMDRLEIAFPDGTTDWLWAGDSDITNIWTSQSPLFLTGSHGDPQSR